MKKIFTLLIGVAFSITVLNAQDPVPGAPPEGFSYKATITKMLPNGNLAIVPLKTIGLMINIRQGTDDGTIVYSETFNPKTNPSGQIDIIIGLNPDLGSPVFSSIPWSEDIFFLQVWVDIEGGIAYGTTAMSTTQLLSVPYALHTKTIADNAITSAKIVDETIVSADLADNAVITSKIYDGAVTGDKIAQADATVGQALKWDGTKWSPNNDLVATPGGISGSIQFNNAGVFDGDANLFWDNTNNRLGIGTTAPNAKLDINGTVQIGSAGKIFSEIREITGLTPSDGYTFGFGYPSGYNIENARILSVEVEGENAEWATLGTYAWEIHVEPNIFVITSTLGCAVTKVNIHCTLPGVEQFHSRPFRILLMKVQ